MKKTIIVLGLVVLVLFSVTYIYAQGLGFGPGHRGMHEAWGPGKGPSLTPEQKTKFQEMRRKFEEENAQIIGAIVAKRLELKALWTDPKADAKAIMDKEKELRDLQNQLMDKIVQSKLEARNLLTPEQITEFGQDCGMGPGFGHGHMMGYGQKMGYRGAGMEMR